MRAGLSVASKTNDVYYVCICITILNELYITLYTASDRSWQSESICALRMKIPQNKLYSTEHIELLSTIGQGIHLISYIQNQVNVFFAGESGLVYKAYVKKGEHTDIYAIKTGKGEKIVGVYY